MLETTQNNKIGGLHFTFCPLVDRIPSYFLFINN